MKKNLFSDMYLNLLFRNNKFDRIQYDNLYDIDYCVSNYYYYSNNNKFFFLVDDLNSKSSFFVNSFINPTYILNSVLFVKRSKKFLRFLYYKKEGKLAQIFESFKISKKKFDYFDYLNKFLILKLKIYLNLSLVGNMVLQKLYGLVLNSIISVNYMNYAEIININFKAIFRYFSYYYVNKNKKFLFMSKIKTSLCFDSNLADNSCFQKKKIISKNYKNLLNLHAKIIQKNRLFYKRVLIVPYKIIRSRFQIFYKFGVLKSLKDSQFIKYVKYVKKYENFVRKNKIDLYFKVYFKSFFSKFVMGLYKQTILQKVFHFSKLDLFPYIKNFLYIWKIWIYKKNKNYYFLKKIIKIKENKIFEK